MKGRMIPALTITGLLSATNALASSGAINITGRIVESSCLVTLGGDSGGHSSVALPVISRDALARAGATAGATPMTMALSDCPPQASVRAWFEPLNVDRNTGNLTNLAANTPAANVQVQITDGSSQNAIDLRNNSNNRYTTIDDDTATLNYAAQYIAVGGAATAGNVESHLVYTLEYR
ncbi:type 1 fimbrial protein [Halomonas cupida]|uniref:fimbrial protein n=1 Tax=Halomonas cupida TaxID=44933 RepID=UPI0039B3A70F